MENQTKTKTDPAFEARVKRAQEKRYFENPREQLRELDALLKAR